MAEESLTSATAIGGLLRYIGGWTAPSGRGLFMFRCMSTSFSAAAVAGLTTAYATALFFGPLASIGFAVGSCVGFVASTMYYWRSAVRTAVVAFDDHPELLYLHLIRNYPEVGFQHVNMQSREAQSTFRQRIRASGLQGLRLRCFLMAAWHTAAPAIEDITSKREANLIARVTQDDVHVRSIEPRVAG